MEAYKAQTRTVSFTSTSHLHARILQYLNCLVVFGIYMLHPRVLGVAALNIYTSISNAILPKAIPKGLHLLSSPRPVL